MDITREKLLEFAQLVYKIQNLLDGLGSRYPVRCYDGNYNRSRYEHYFGMLVEKYKGNDIPLVVDGHVSGVYKLVFTLYKVSLVMDKPDILFECKSIGTYFNII